MVKSDLTRNKNIYSMISGQKEIVPTSYHCYNLIYILKEGKGKQVIWYCIVKDQSCISALLSSRVHHPCALNTFLRCMGTLLGEAALPFLFFASRLNGVSS